jgi:L-ectoine synthase
MKVVRAQKIVGTDRDVNCPKGGFNSLRFLLAKDGMGFSLHKTTIPVGPPQHWHYKHHLEACYCISGKGLLTNLTTGEYYAIAPDSVYVLDNHDDHQFEALETTVLISVFNPPVTGREVHGDDGSYRIESEMGGES